MNARPYLVEPGAKYFLNETLKNCNYLKEKYKNLLFNIGVLILFCVALGSFLYSRYKGKMSPTERRKKDIEKQQFIMSKIRNYHASKKVGQLTGLPEYYSGGNDLIY
jgi:hypothetical protein